MKITIETDDGIVQKSGPTQTSAVPGTAPGQPGAAGAGFSISDVEMKAASLGANNAGPAPSLSGVVKQPGPVAASVGGAQPTTSMVTSSAGSPPPHVFGPAGGCK